jgi:hypothetical protein
MISLIKITNILIQIWNKIQDLIKKERYRDKNQDKEIEVDQKKKRK